MVNYITFERIVTKNISITPTVIYENFITYTEVDEHDDITVTATKVKWVDMDLNSTSYVYKDFGINHFTDFSHNLELEINTTHSNGKVSGWGLANVIKDFDAILDDGDEAIVISMLAPGGSYRLYIQDIKTYNTDYVDVSVDTLYYCTVERTGTTATLYVYDDAARTSLIDSASITCTSDAFRYLYACMGTDEAQTTKEGSGYSQNFDIKETDIDSCHIDLTPVGTLYNRDCVNDPIDKPDEDVTYVYNSTPSLEYDLYKLPNHTTESGIINYIKIHGRAKSHLYTQHVDGIFKLILTDDACSNIYKSNDIDITTSYVTYNNKWLINPRTTNAWTWDDIDNLQIGVECSSPTVGENEPEIRTTQCYAEVNYSPSKCNLIAPEEVSTDHVQNINEMNMWNGERIVFGESRSKWSLLLKGQDWESDACDKILCLKQQGLDGLPIVISGLNNTNWDTEWLIKSIGWKLILEKPLHYEWIILLEKI